jgi:ATP-dependent Clp protease ATP-binding subunit ClpA
MWEKTDSGGRNMPRKSELERLQEIEQKIVQLRAQKQQLEARVKQKERKERTRRLIQIGATFEKWWDVRTHEEADWLIKSLEAQGLDPDRIKDAVRKRQGQQAAIAEPIVAELKTQG